MPTDIQTFRQHVLDEVLRLKAIRPEAQLHLLYLPALHDPLGLVDDRRRVTALIRAPGRRPATAPDKDRAPRLLTLDCRRVAAYLLETDAALDDPLFESSITQSHAEACLGQRPNAELNNDQPAYAGSSVGGWLIGTGSAGALALRLQNFSQGWLARQQQGRRCCTNPAVLGALWPTLSADQRRDLLGDTVWVAVDGAGKLRRYAVGDTIEATRNVWHGTQPGAVSKNTILVNDLLPRRQALLDEHGHRLPPDALGCLHALVQEAQAHGLDPASVAIHVMTAVQLKPGAMREVLWLDQVRDAARYGRSLADALALLDDAIWGRWALSTDSDRDVRPAA